MLNFSKPRPYNVFYRSMVIDGYCAWKLNLTMQIPVRYVYGITSEIDERLSSMEDDIDQLYDIIEDATQGLSD